MRTKRLSGSSSPKERAVHPSLPIALPGHALHFKRSLILWLQDTLGLDAFSLLLLVR